MAGRPMATEQARRAHQIFTRALDVSPPDRMSFVQQICDGDDALRARVLRLLGTLETITTFLESPAIPPPRRPEPMAPDMVPGYRILGVLGSGGMATVYQAEQENPPRPVALKVMHRTLAHTSAVQRFRFEVEVLARLSHPGIAPIYEAGTFRDPSGYEIPYFAMEFVPQARPLNRFVRDEQLTRRARLTMFAAICDAVQHGHQLGVIHRDLKPGNILVGADGRARIIDFGIARSVDPGGEPITLQSDAGQLLGTMHYMSPEQCTGTHVIDTRADVYALGVILYELVTGRTPHDFSGVTLHEALSIIQSRTPPRPRSTDRSIDPDLDAIITTAISIAPEHRCQGADALAADVRAYLADKPVQARRQSAWRQARLFTRRHRTFVAMLMLLFSSVTVLSVGIGVLGYLGWKESRQRILAEQRALLESRTAQRQAYAAGIAGAFLAYQSREVSQAQERLEEIPEPMRGWEWNFAQALVDTGDQTLVASNDQITALDLATQSRRILVGFAGGSYKVIDADTGETIEQLDPTDQTRWTSAALSADARSVFLGDASGRLSVWRIGEETAPAEQSAFPAGIGRLARTGEDALLVATEDGSLTVWSPSRPTAERPTRRFTRGIAGLEVSGDGRSAVVWSSQGNVTVVDTGTLDELAVFDLEARANAGCLSSDGRLVAVGGQFGRIRVWDVRTGSLELENERGPLISSIRGLAFDSDASTLYSGQIDRSLRAWSLDDGRQTWSRVRHHEAVSSMRLDPGSGRLLSASLDGTLRAWPLDTPPGSSSLQIIRAHADHALSVDFSPDGSILASAGRDDVVRLWDPELLIELASLRGHEGDVFSARFSPDGRRIVSSGADGTVRVWDIQAGTSRTLSPVKRGTVWSCSFSPDGRLIAATGDDGVVLVWDARTLGLLHEFVAHDHRSNCLAFSPDSGLIATTSRAGEVAVWSSLDGSLVHRLGGHDSDAFSCRFTSDGSKLFTASRDQTMRIWDVATGAEIRSVPHRGQFLTSLSMSADGTRIAAGSWFTEISIVDTQSGDVFLKFPGSNSAIRSVCFSPNGEFLVSAGHDGDLYSYDARPLGVRVLARAEAQARLDAARLQVRRMSDPSGRFSINLDAPGLTPDQRAWLFKARLLEKLGAEPRDRDAALPPMPVPRSITLDALDHDAGESGAQPL